MTAHTAPGTTSAPVTRLRLTRRGRIVFTTLGALPIAIVAFVLGLNGGDAMATGQAAGVEFSYVTVHAGESLWSVAEGVAPEADPRDVVDELVSLNQLGDAVIEPGQRLAVPVRYAD